MKIAIGSDHAGFALKELVVKHLEERGLEVEDLGTHSTDSVNYPDYGRAVGKAVVEGKADLGIAICGTGVGISISANKVRGVRCACVSETYSAKRARQHNNANVLAFGARVIGSDVAMDIVDAFLDAKFEGGRHEKRVCMITEIEEENA